MLLAASLFAGLPIVAVVFILVLVILFFYFVPVGLWIAARFSGAPVGLFGLVAMRLRRVSPANVVNPLINATKAGLKISTVALSAA